MHGLSMETAFVILEKSTIHCSAASFYNIHSFVVWDNFLGYWLQEVGRIWCELHIESQIVSPRFLILIKLLVTVEQSNKISSMQWAQCMLLFSSLGYKMQRQCSQLWLLREQSFTEREQLECIQLHHMPLDRYYICLGQKNLSNVFQRKHWCQ